ncbi:hypothetical protein H5410_051073, partial [Solanum commersonii]
MWASGKRCRLTTCDSSQVPHASKVAYAHLANDVSQRQATSSDFYTHLMWLVRFGQVTLANDMLDVVLGLPALTVAFLQRLVIVGSGLPASFVSCTCQVSDVTRGNICRDLVDNMRMLRPTSADKGMQVTNDAARPCPTSDDLCVQATNDDVRPCLMLADRCVQATNNSATDDAGNSCPTSVDRCVQFPNDTSKPRPTSADQYMQATDNSGIPYS